MTKVNNWSKGNYRVKLGSLIMLIRQVLLTKITILIPFVCWDSIKVWHNMSRSILITADISSSTLPAHKKYTYVTQILTLSNLNTSQLFCCLTYKPNHGKCQWNEWETIFSISTSTAIIITVYYRPKIFLRLRGSLQRTMV